MRRLRILGAALVVAAGVLSGPAGAAGCGGDAGSCPALVYQGFTYPYPREPGSYLFVDGAVYPYVRATERLLGDSTVRLPDGSEIAAGDLLAALGLADLAAEPLVPTVGYGSNPAPSQLARKYAAQSAAGTAVIPVMKGHLSGYDVAWTPAFVTYGAMPATLVPSPGTVVDVWITWLSESFLRHMNETEHVGVELYVLAQLSGVDYAFDGPEPGSLEVYISCFGALSIDGETLAVASVPALHRTFRPVDAAGALRAVMPTLGWHGSVLDLLYANVSDPGERARRTDALRPLRDIVDDPHAKGMAPCAASRNAPARPF